MEFERGAILRAAAQGDLELAWQVRELGMDGGPLPDDFRKNAWILAFICRRAGEMIGGDIAYAVAARLQAMHLDGGEVGKRIGHIHQLDPVELDVLPGRKMAIAPVVFARDLRQHPQLPRRERAVRNGDAQHVSVELKIKTVHQPERLEFVFGEFAGEPPLHLISELLDPVPHEARIEFVVPIHERTPPPPLWGGRRNAAERNYVGWGAD